MIDNIIIRTLIISELADESVSVVVEVEVCFAEVESEFVVDDWVEDVVVEEGSGLGVDVAGLDDEDDDSDTLITLNLPST